MSPELEDKLVRKYPQLFQDVDKPETESLMCFGCECGDGWYTLIDRLCGRIVQYLVESIGDETPTYRFVQIKEKFGGLRVYDTGATDTIFGLIDMAETMSYVTCELCGAPAELCTTGYWLRTLCPTCAEQNGYRPRQKDDDV